MSGGRRIKKPAPKAKARRRGKGGGAGRRRRPPPDRPSRRWTSPSAGAFATCAVNTNCRWRRSRDRTDLSIGFLSQIERGLSSPSLRVLATLADVLGVGIAALFGSKPSDDPASGGVVTRQLQRAELKLWRTGISKQLLSPAGTENRLNLFLVHLEPGGNTGDELYTHDGEEAGLVLEGEMTLTVDAETWSLKTGDSFRFASRRPHRFSNPAEDAKAVVLWVNCVTAAS